jgi:hypothetical protein
VADERFGAPAESDSAFGLTLKGCQTSAKNPYTRQHPGGIRVRSETLRALEARFGDVHLLLLGVQKRPRLRQEAIEIRPRCATRSLLVSCTPTEPSGRRAD